MALCMFGRRQMYFTKEQCQQCFVLSSLVAACRRIGQAFLNCFQGGRHPPAFFVNVWIWLNSYTLHGPAWSPNQKHCPRGPSSFSTGAQCPETNLDVPLKDGWLIRSPQYSSLRLLCVENIEVSQSVRDAGVFVDINCFGVRGIPVYPSGVVNPGKFIVAQVFFFFCPAIKLSRHEKLSSPEGLRL